MSLDGKYNVNLFYNVQRVGGVREEEEVALDGVDGVGNVLGTVWCGKWEKKRLMERKREGRERKGR